MFGLITGALSAQQGKELEFKDALKWACKILNIKHTYKATTDKKVESNEDEDQLYNVVKIFAVML